MVKSVTFYHKVQLNRCRLRLRSRSRLGSLQVSPNLAREGREQSLQSLSDLQRQVSSYILIFMMSVFTTIGQSAQRSRPDSTPTHTDTQWVYYCFITAHSAAANVSAVYLRPTTLHCWRHASDVMSRGRRKPCIRRALRNGLFLVHFFH